MAVTINGLTSKDYLNTSDLFRVDDASGIAYSIAAGDINKSSDKRFNPGSTFMLSDNVQDAIVEILEAPEVGPNAYFQQSYSKVVKVGPTGDFLNLSDAIVAGERLVSRDSSNPRPEKFYTIELQEDYDPQGATINLGGGFDLSHMAINSSTRDITQFDLNINIGDGTKGPMFCVGLTSLKVDGYEASASILRTFLHGGIPLIFGDITATNSGVITIKPTEMYTLPAPPGVFTPSILRVVGPLEVIIQVTNCVASKLGKITQKVDSRTTYGVISSGTPTGSFSNGFKVNYTGTVDLITVVGDVSVQESSIFTTRAAGNQVAINCSLSSTALFGSFGYEYNTLYGGTVDRASILTMDNSTYTGNLSLTVSGASEASLNNNGYDLLDTPPLDVSGSSKVYARNKRWSDLEVNLTVSKAGRIYLDDECVGYNPSVTLNAFTSSGLIQGPVG